MRGPIQAEWCPLLVCPPEQPIVPAGILLLDRQLNQLFFKLKPKLHTGLEEIDLVWNQLPEELSHRVTEIGADQVMVWLETTWSHVFRVSDSRPLETDELEQSLASLYQEHVEGSTTLA
jgi:hypothetical protein